jgi:hypothetical protein
MQFKQANSSLWDGMVVHFVNNASVNFFHVVYTNGMADGTESNPTMRIAIAQTLMFIIVAVRWYLWRKKNPVLPVIRHQILHAPRVNSLVWSIDGANLQDEGKK